MSDEPVGQSCVEPGCTGVFVPENQRQDYTGWSFAIDEGDVPAHDCRTIDEG